MSNRGAQLRAEAGPLIAALAARWGWDGSRVMGANGMREDRIIARAVDLAGMGWSTQAILEDLDSFSREPTQEEIAAQIQDLRERGEQSGLVRRPPLW